VQRIEIAGVPVFTAPGPDRVTAALMFGVGLRDETYATLGVTHLIEHLVMGALPKSHLDCNATVDVESTMFYATGKPEAVATFLTRVCEALSDLPTDRMALEVGSSRPRTAPAPTRRPPHSGPPASASPARESRWPVEAYPRV
jgi:hypothetical protein